MVIITLFSCDTDLLNICHISNTKTFKTTLNITDIYLKLHSCLREFVWLIKSLRALRRKGIINMKFNLNTVNI